MAITTMLRTLVMQHQQVLVVLAAKITSVARTCVKDWRPPFMLGNALTLILYACSHSAAVTATAPCLLTDASSMC
eukprot:1107-Heterococcus_DN1.PRE.1